MTNSFSVSRFFSLALFAWLLCLVPEARAALAITSTSPLPTGTVGVPYSFGFSASGGSGTLTWSSVQGAVPGLGLGANGTLSGTPMTPGVYTITVQVADSTGASAQGGFTVPINASALEILTNSLPGGLVGVPYSQALSATGGTVPYSWTVTAGTLPGGIGLSSGGVLSGTPTAPGSFGFTVQVRDSLGAMASKSFTIVVRGPSLACPAASGTVGVGYSSALAASGGTPPYSFSIASGSLPPGLSLNSATGAITGTPTASGKFAIAFRVEDSTSAIGTANCGIAIAPSPISLACPAAGGTVGVSYSSALAASGGTPPYTFSVASGALPPGLTLNSTTGAVTGTPTASGNFAVSFRVVDSAGADTTASCGIAIAPPPLSLACPAASGTVGVSYSSALAASGGTPPYTFSIASGSLPPGLTLNSTTGAVTGTPTASGNFAVSFRVADSAGADATANCGISITASPVPLTLACPAESGTVGVSYSSALAASGGTPPYTFSTSGSLPPGLSLNASTGAITGTPISSGNFSITPKVQDSAGATATANCGINITTAPAPLSLACPAASGTPGVSYSSGLTAGGGTAPFTFSITAGSLPPGLTLNGATGAITGTPGSSGNFAITFKVQDSAGATASANCGINITAAPGPSPLSLACPASGTLNAAYVSGVAASGGTAPYAFSITAGTLPGGLSFNAATGAITGTPAAAGTFPVSFQVRDASGATTTANCGILIAGTGGLQLTGTCPAGPFAPNSPVTISLTPSGGTPPYSFQLSGPVWLTLSAGSSGVTITGTPPATGAFTFTVTMTDSANSAPATYSCSFNVAQPLAVAAACPAPVAPATPVSVPLKASGGTAPYAWTLSGPSWLALQSASGTDNVLAGTPPAAGSYDFTVTLADSVGSKAATFACKLQAGVPLQITSSGCPAAAVAPDAAVSISYTATGGNADYTWSYSGPSSLQLSATSGSTVTLSGTAPAQVGTYSTQVTLKDSAGSTPATSTCGITVKTGPQIQAACPDALVQGQAFSLPLSVAGGSGNYTWSLSGPSWLSLASTNGTTNSLSGTPPDTGTFPFTVTVTDASGAPAATFSCTLTVNLAALTIQSSETGGTSGCPANPLVLSAPFSLSLQANGGSGDYTWTLSGPTWLSLASAKGASNTVAGTPPAPGSFPFQVQLGDTANSTPATLSCTLVVRVPAIPSARLVGLTLTQNPLQPVTVGLQFDTPVPVDLQAELALSFTSSAAGVTDNAQVQFLDPNATSQGRRLPFTIPAGTTSLTITKFQQGTVAGSIHVQLSALKVAGQDVLPPSPPQGDVAVPKLRPVILGDLAFQNETATGFTVAIQGYSTPRDLAAATLSFTAAAGAKLDGSTQFRVDVSGVSGAYYQSPDSRPGGSSFLLRIPVNISGDKTAIGSVTVTLVNSAGESDPVSKNR